MAKPILEVDSLGKTYGSFIAVDQVSFTVQPGEVVGLLGPNGAGKTTTINMVLGILEPTAGTVKVGGRNLQTHRASSSAAMNFAAVYAQVPANLTVYQNLYVFGLLYGVKHLRQRLHDLLRDFDLERFTSTKAGHL